MKEEKLEVNGKIYTIRELKYKEITSFSQNKEEAGKQFVVKSTGISDEDYDNLSMNEGVKIMNIINRINGLDDLAFQKPIPLKD